MQHINLSINTDAINRISTIFPLLRRGSGGGVFRRGLVGGVLLLISTLSHSQLNWSGTQTLTNGQTINQNINLTGNVTINVEDGTAIISGVISSSSTYTVTKTGLGDLYLTGNNTYTGTTTISAGILRIGNNTTTGDIAGNIVNNANLYFYRYNDYTYSGVISGTGYVYQRAIFSTLTLNGANTYTGATYTSGMLALGPNGTIEYSQYVGFFSGGKLDISSGNKTVKGLHSNTNPPQIILGASVLTIGTSATSADGGGNFEGYITGTGGIVKTGTQTLTLTGNNTYTGTTTISAGTIALGNNGSIAASSSVNLDGNTSKLDISANNKTIKALNGNNASAQVLLGTRILTIGTSETTDDGGGNFAGVISGTGSVIKTGTENLFFTGDNTYEGTTTISAGTLSLGNNTEEGAIAGDIINDANLIFNRSNEYTWYVGVVSGTGSVTKMGSGDLILPFIQNYTGVTTISEGGFVFGNFPDEGFIAGDIINNGRLYFHNDLDYTYSGVISGDGSVSLFSVLGSLTLNGENTYTGETYIHTPLILGTNGSIAASSSVNLGDFYETKLDISAGNKTIKALNGKNTSAQIVLGTSALTIGTSATTADGGGTFEGVILGTGSIIKTGNQTLFLKGNNSYTGTTTINAGILSIGDNSTTGAIVGDIVNNANLSFRRSDDYNYSGIISGTGVVVKNHKSTLTLNGANTYTGETFIYEGTLALGQSGSIANSKEVILYEKFDISAGAKTIRKLNSADIEAEVILGARNLTIGISGQPGDCGVFSGNFTGTGSVQKSGTGIFNLRGNNTATGTFLLTEGKVMLENTWEGNFYQFGNTTLEIIGNSNIGGNLTLAGGTINMDLRQVPLSKIEINGTVSALEKTTLNVLSGNVSNYILMLAESGLNNASDFILNTPGTGTLTALGQFLMLNVTNVNIEKLGIRNNELSIYPNPTTGQLRITNYEFQEEVAGDPETSSGRNDRSAGIIEIFEMTGRPVGAYSIRPDGLVDISNLPAGIYMLKVGNKSVRVVKTVVSKE